MITVTRRKALGLLGAAAVPSVAVIVAAPALTAETQEAKCRRLIFELMAEMAKLPTPISTMGGPAVDLIDDGNDHIRFSPGKMGDRQSGALLVVTLGRSLS